MSCAWAKPGEPHLFEFCEEGAKATTWEITNRRCTRPSLRSWSDHELEEKGRLTQPLRWDAGSDTYVPVDWGETFSAIGRELRNLDPKSVVFYSLSRASLEAFYMYALFARMYGNNSFNHDRWRRATPNG